MNPPPTRPQGLRQVIQLKMQPSTPPQSPVTCPNSQGAPANYSITNPSCSSTTSSRGGFNLLKRHGGDQVLEAGACQRGTSGSYDSHHCYNRTTTRNRCSLTESHSGNLPAGAFRQSTIGILTFLRSGFSAGLRQVMKRAQL